MRSSLDSGRGECVIIPHVHFYYWLGMCREDETGKKAECYSFIHFLPLFILISEMIFAFDKVAGT